MPGSAAEQKAANVTAPIDREVNDDFQVRKFTSESTHAANAVPASWHGKFVTMYATGTVHFAFSERSAAEVDISVSATAGGASAKVGGLITDVPRSMRVPRPAEPGGTIYFVRESATSETVWMELSSD